MNCIDHGPCDGAYCSACEQLKAGIDVSIVTLRQVPNMDGAMRAFKEPYDQHWRECIDPTCSKCLRPYPNVPFMRPQPTPADIATDKAWERFIP